MVKFFSFRLRNNYESYVGCLTNHRFIYSSLKAINPKHVLGAVIVLRIKRTQHVMQILTQLLIKLELSQSLSFLFCSSCRTNVTLEDNIEREHLKSKTAKWSKHNRINKMLQVCFDRAYIIAILQCIYMWGLLWRGMLFLFSFSFVACLAWQ